MSWGLVTTGTVLVYNTHDKNLYILPSPTWATEACSKKEHNSDTERVLWNASWAGITFDEMSSSCDRQRRTVDCVRLYVRISARTEDEVESMSCECQNKQKLMD
jgi:hypothetical protein